MTWEAWALLFLLLATILFSAIRKRLRARAERSLHDFVSGASLQCEDGVARANNDLLCAFLLGKSAAYAFCAGTIRREFASGKDWKRIGPPESDIDQQFLDLMEKHHRKDPRVPLRELAAHFRKMSDSHQEDERKMMVQHNASTDPTKKRAASLMASGFGGLATAYKSAAKDADEYSRALDGVDVAVRAIDSEHKQ
jgi:hypothetical protein